MAAAAAAPASARRIRRDRPRPAATDLEQNGDAPKLIPLFPLQLVLFPGVALPLHIFEPRYRLMVKRCLELNQAFGVIRSGNDGLSEIGTLAEIREATRYIDGRWDIVALGTQRFRVTNFDRSAPYLQAEVEILDEAVGEPAERVRATAERVSDLFIDYLELLRGVDEGEHDHNHDNDDEEEEGEYIEDDEVTPEAIDEALEEEQGAALSQEVVSEIERLLVASNTAAGPAKITEYNVGDDESPDDEGDPDGELLATAIDRLSGSDDPVGLSHVVGGVVQLTVEQRQALLEAPDALARLTLLAAHLDRENLLLAEGIRPWQADPVALAERRN
ncbi:MAG: LON peptidase substrate-binding domain-containing protein [Chloroflexi bacterium]|nr:LON peptidase substrate-binding domain-containing protein [Chloroflexota bacterium]